MQQKRRQTATVDIAADTETNSHSLHCSRNGDKQPQLTLQQKRRQTATVYIAAETETNSHSLHCSRNGDKQPQLTLQQKRRQTATVYIAAETETNSRSLHCSRHGDKQPQFTLQQKRRQTATVYIAAETETNSHSLHCSRNGDKQPQFTLQQKRRQTATVDIAADTETNSHSLHCSRNGDKQPQFTLQQKRRQTATVDIAAETETNSHSLHCSRNGDKQPQFTLQQKRRQTATVYIAASCKALASVPTGSRKTSSSSWHAMGPGFRGTERFASSSRNSRCNQGLGRAHQPSCCGLPPQRPCSRELAKWLLKLFIQEQELGDRNSHDLIVLVGPRAHFPAFPHRLGASPGLWTTPFVRAPLPLVRAPNTTVETCRDVEPGQELKFTQAGPLPFTGLAPYRWTGWRQHDSGREVTCWGGGTCGERSPWKGLGAVPPDVGDSTVCLGRQGCAGHGFWRALFAWIRLHTSGPRRCATSFAVDSDNVQATQLHAHFSATEPPEAFEVHPSYGGVMNSEHESCS